MPEIHLRQSGITYSDRVPFAKHKERIPIFKENQPKIIHINFVCKSKIHNFYQRK